MPGTGPGRRRRAECPERIATCRSGLEVASRRLFDVCWKGRCWCVKGKVAKVAKIATFCCIPLPETAAVTACFAIPSITAGDG